MTIVQLLPPCLSHPGTTASNLTALESKLGMLIPDDYKAFLMQNDGVEGFVSPQNYLVLWSADEILDLNRAYSVFEFLPNSIILGTNGSDTAYGFTSHDGAARYFSVPLVGMNLSEVVIIGTTLVDVLNWLRNVRART